MKTKFRKVMDITSWFMLIILALLVVYVTANNITASKNNEEVFIFGYRPIIVLTGSMEPYMMTNSVAITKEVHSMDDIEIGDVITFHVENQLGQNVRITHRLMGIEDGKLVTQGDNNNSADGLNLTIDNVESKVILVLNQTAWLASMWGTTSGKVMIICFLVALILAYAAVKLMLSSRSKEDSVDGTLQIESNLPVESEGCESTVSEK